MNKDQGLNLLKEKIDFIDTLAKEKSRDNLRQWREETLMILDSLIDQESKYYSNFENIGFTSSVLSMRDRDLNQQRNAEAYQKGLEKARASLKAIVFGVEKGLF